MGAQAGEVSELSRYGRPAGTVARGWDTAWPYAAERERYRAHVADMSGPTLSWRVRREILALKFVALVGFLALAALSAGDPRGMFLAGAGAVAAAVLALRDILVPVRLRADGEGLVVARGFAGSERLPWSAVERIRVDRRTRLTSRTELLEIDAGEAVFVLSRFDLGAPCQEVAEELRSFRTGC